MLGFLPGVAALAGVAVLGYAIAGAPTLLDAFTRALVFVPVATAAYFSRTCCSCWSASGA